MLWPPGSSASCFKRATEVLKGARQGIGCSACDPGAKAGVKDMILHCAEFMANDEVARLVDSINLKLGMTTEACARWRSAAMHCSD